MLVLRSGQSRRSETRNLVDLLQRRHVDILGTLVVDVPEHYLEQTRTGPKHSGAANTAYEENSDANPDALQNA